jgi:hypothetical protein
VLTLLDDMMHCLPPLSALYNSTKSTEAEWILPVWAWGAERSLDNPRMMRSTTYKKDKVPECSSILPTRYGYPIQDITPQSSPDLRLD